MGGVIWCKYCQTSHGGPTGSKCQQLKETDLLEITANKESNGQASGSTVTSEQARLEANHVTLVKDSSTVASTATSVNQDVILAERQKIY